MPLALESLAGGANKAPNSCLSLPEKHVECTLVSERELRWLISIRLMQAVVASARRGEGPDLVTKLLEPLPRFANLVL